MKPKPFIGIDLHTNQFTVCFLRKDKKPEYKIYTLDEEGITTFLKTVTKASEVAVEATANALYFSSRIEKRVAKVHIVNPNKFTIISQSAQKSDLQDSYKLALFLSKGMLPKARLKSNDVYQLKSLIDTRTQLVRMRSALLRKMHSVLIRNGIKIERNKLATKSGFSKYVFSRTWSDEAMIEINTLYEHINRLKDSVDYLEKEIKKEAEKTSGYINLLSMGGIGPLSAATLLTVIGDVNDFRNSAALCSYFGIVPRIRQSNETIIRGGITRAGSRVGRATLVQCTWVVVKFSPYFKKFYERLKKRSIPQKAIVACSRKFLVLIYRVLKNDWVYDNFAKNAYHTRTNENRYSFQGDYLIINGKKNILKKIPSSKN